MYSLTLKAILNRVQPIKGFVYQSVRFSQVVTDTIEVAVVPREGSKARCSGCGRQCSTYDHLKTRTWAMTPLWIFAIALIYTMRRVACPTCGVVVEKVPWATGKHSLCDGFRLFLAHWARKLSWDEVAGAYGVSWADVYGAIAYYLRHRSEVDGYLQRQDALWQDARDQWNQRSGAIVLRLRDAGRGALADRP